MNIVGFSSDVQQYYNSLHTREIGHEPSSVSTVEKFYVSMLHVLFIFLHSSPRVAVRCKADISFSTGSAEYFVSQ